MERRLLNLGRGFDRLRKNINSTFQSLLKLYSFKLLIALSWDVFYSNKENIFGWYRECVFKDLAYCLFIILIVQNLVFNLLSKKCFQSVKYMTHKSKWCLDLSLPYFTEPSMGNPFDYIVYNCKKLFLLTSSILVDFFQLPPLLNFQSQL